MKIALGVSKNKKPTQKVASQGEFEAGFIYMYGKAILMCTDENGIRRNHTYSKHCLGVAGGVALSLSKVSNSQDISCSNPPKQLIGAEIGFTLGMIDIDASCTFEMKNKGSTSTSGGLSKGVGLDLGVKACIYKLISSKIVGY